MMIQMYVAGIGLEEKSKQPLVLLNDLEKQQVLPIMIGVTEAKAISKALQKIVSNRPTTHDLLSDVINSFGYKVDHVAIDNVRNETYMSKVALIPGSVEDREMLLELDARPSDALVLAIKREVPIYVSDEILSTSGLKLHQVVNTELDGEQFKDFVKSVKASDFNQYGPGTLDAPE